MFNFLSVTGVFTPSIILSPTLYSIKNSGCSSRNAVSAFAFEDKLRTYAVLVLIGYFFIFFCYFITTIAEIQKKLHSLEFTCSYKFFLRKIPHMKVLP